MSHRWAQLLCEFWQQLVRGDKKEGCGNVECNSLWSWLKGPKGVAWECLVKRKQMEATQALPWTSPRFPQTLPACTSLRGVTLLCYICISKFQ